MKRLSFSTILRRSAVDILDSLDMRKNRSYTPLRRGESVERAWANTGMYLRRAMDSYEQTTSSTGKPR